MASSERTRRLLRDRMEMQRAKVEQEQQKMKELGREEGRAKVQYVECIRLMVLRLKDGSCSRSIRYHPISST